MDCAENCPLVKNLRIPKEGSPYFRRREEGGDGVPDVIAVGYHKVKRESCTKIVCVSFSRVIIVRSSVLQTAKKEKGTVKDEDMTYKLLWRNTNNACLCPVNAMFFHLGASGLLKNPEAPLYGNFDRGGKILIADHEKAEVKARGTAMYWFTKGGERVSLSCSQVATSANRVFQRTLGLQECTDHVIRVFIAAWGGHCGRELTEMLEIGEWMSFTSMEWYRYFKDAKRVSTECALRHDEDPVAKLFPWPAMGMNPAAMSVSPYKDWTPFIPRS